MRACCEPSFLICGSGESGTSWLYGCLLQHPEIYLPKEMRPEPHFFFKSREYEKPFQYYLETYFRDVPPAAKAVGERSSSYMFGPGVAERIRKHLPSVKMIFMLRDPVERAFSNWRFTVQNGLESASFERAVDLEEQRLETEKDPFWREIQPYAYVKRGLYAEQIKRFFDHFPGQQLLILNSDWVKENEPQALVRVCDFLGVDRGFQFDSPGTFPTSWVRSKTVQVLLRRLYGRDFDRAIESTRVKAEFRTQDFRGRPILDSILRRNLSSDRPRLDPRTREKLAGIYRDSNERLRQFVDWDPLDWYAWKQPTQAAR